ncbi:bifunctional glutamate--cysteine ligase/glutathione synthetase [Leptospira perolatii]|uniref:Bifunctional glutamate--cysteine ligase/glutathione synthetase n=1 Tax=Leptospira perolatii TaxID=2023191 RepID=A0A2M9ZJJ0_9LEPT|nr:bifunctional glutamate--cysteine ligase/glutathione synthetase [Leptospira perolatii]PJZ72220.1 bifunctional glutamate--cysteine ligase/glutathione synthetase [Leptospira perolatii]
MKIRLEASKRFDPNQPILEGFEDMEISSQIVIRDALNRGLEVEILDRKNHFIRVRNGKEYRLIKEASKTDLDSYMTFLIMENKIVTKQVLAEKGIEVPIGTSVNSKEEGIQYFRANPSLHLVVKPTTTNFGIGISILPPNSNLELVRNSLDLAFAHGESVIIEEFVPGNEYRFLVLGEECVAVCNRVPANVLGDGVSSVGKLVQQKNSDTRRGVGHVTPLEKIKLEETELGVLHSQGFSIESIPKKGETVFLRKNSNISTGGDSIDVTDIAHSFYCQMAVEAAKAVGAKICGVDIIVQDLEKKGSYKILELNFNPVLYIHNYPYQGKNRDVGNKILDLLGF